MDKKNRDMSIWEIIIIILAILNVISICLTIYAVIVEWQADHVFKWPLMLMGLFIYPAILFVCIGKIFEFLLNVYDDGGFKKHWEKLTKEKEERRQREIEMEADTL